MTLVTQQELEGVQPHLCQGGTHESDSFWQVGGFKGDLRNMIVRVTLWYIIKWVFWLTIIGLGFFGLFQFDKLSDGEAEQISVHLSNEAYYQAARVFFSGAKIKVNLFNADPIYQSELIKEIEEDTGVKFKKLFWTAKVDGVEWLIMEQPAKDANGDYLIKSRNYFTSIFDSDAQNYCEQFAGDLADYKVVKKASLHLGIKAPLKNEMFADNTVKEGVFRCMTNRNVFRPAE